VFTFVLSTLIATNNNYNYSNNHLSGNQKAQPQLHTIDLSNLMILSILN